MRDGSNHRLSSVGHFLPSIHSVWCWTVGVQMWASNVVSFKRRVHDSGSVVCFSSSGVLKYYAPVVQSMNFFFQF